MKNFFTFLFFWIPSISYPQWNAGSAINTPVAIATYDQQDLRIVSDSKKGAIITWVDYRNNPLNADIYAQRIDSTGTVKWTTNGINICSNAAQQAAPVLSEDGKGGAIIVWQDWRSGNRDIYAQRIDKNGNIKWTSGGVGLCVKPFHQESPKSISDGLGGAWVTWQDSVNGSWDVYAQQVDSNGISQWTGGLGVCTAVNAQINPRIESDGMGNAIFTWQDKRGGLDYDIYAQKLNISGVALWLNGVAVCVEAGSQINPKIEPDGVGGVYIAWQDKRTGADYDVYVQRLNSAGTPLWSPSNGVAVCSASGSQSAIDMASEDVHGAIITWKDSRGTYPDIYAQRIAADGQSKWAANGIPVSNAALDQLNPNIIGDGLGGGIVVWQDSSTGSWDVYSQRLDSNGNALWQSNGVVVGNAAGNQTSPKNTTDGRGGAIYAFQDKRGGDFDIYAHHLYSNGYATGIEKVTFPKKQIVCFPNPFQNRLTISVNDAAVVEYEFLLFNSTGENIIGMKIKDPGDFILNKNIPDGIYFYKITTVDGTGNYGLHTGVVVKE